MKNSKQELINLWLWVNKINRNNQEKGNTLILAMGIGLVLVIITSMALVNSSKDKTNTTAGEFTKQAIATAEAGITRTTNKLNSVYPYYLKLDYDPNNSVDEWANPPSNVGVSPCAPSAGSTALQAVLTENLDSNRSYQIKKYTYNDTAKQGTLLLQGQKNNGGMTSKAEIEVAMNIETLYPPSNFPGIYGEQVINIGNNNVLGSEGNIICTDCTSTLPLDCTAGEPSDAYLKDALGAGSNATIDGNMIIGTPKLPPYPMPPSVACNATTGPVIDCFILISNLKNVTDPALNNFPRTQDINNRKNLLGSSSPDLSKPYYYIVKNDGAATKPDSISGTSLTINSSVAPVRMYVLGNVGVGGNSYIAHSGTLEKFAILGCTQELNIFLQSKGISPTCISPLEAQSITLGGSTSAVNVFIYAPTATVGINGTGSFEAVVWARAWDLSSGNTSTITIPSNAGSLLTTTFGSDYLNVGIPVNRIKSTASWTRKQASN